MLRFLFLVLLKFCVELDMGYRAHSLFSQVLVINKLGLGCHPGAVA